MSISYLVLVFSLFFLLFFSFYFFYGCCFLIFQFLGHFLSFLEFGSLDFSDFLHEIGLMGLFFTFFFLLLLIIFFYFVSCLKPGIHRYCVLVLFAYLKKLQNLRLLKKPQLKSSFRSKDMTLFCFSCDVYNQNTPKLTKCS